MQEIKTNVLIHDLDEVREENRKSRVKTNVSIRLRPDLIESAKTMTGTRGYSSFMARLIEYGLSSEDAVRKCL